MVGSRTKNLIVTALAVMAFTGCGEDRQTVEDRVFKEFTRLVCTNSEPETADDVIAYAHFILKYNENSGHITAAQLVNSSSSYVSEKPPQIAWTYSIDKVYKGTDYLLFDLKLGSDDDRDATHFELDRSDLSMRVSAPGLLSTMHFQCEKMNDDEFGMFLKDRNARLEEIESKNQI